MSLSGVISSPYQRKLFIFTSSLIISVSIIVSWVLYYITPETRGWNIIIDFLVAIVASATFALVSAMYIAFFFRDPFEIASAVKILPQDIDQTLIQMAQKATDYKLFVRTGRHFRAEILPVLIKSAERSRRPVRIEVILLDFRADEICERYANYRKNASFDGSLWTKKYVQKEILATIMSLIDAASTHNSLVSVNLYLSRRLSTFRIDGSSDEIIITREDPKDIASRYRRDDSDYSAFLSEFAWIRDEAVKMKAGNGKSSLPTTVADMFDGCQLVEALSAEAADAKSERSPYAR